MIASFLKCSTTVTSIDLTKNLIGNDGAIVLADTIKRLDKSTKEFRHFGWLMTYTKTYKKKGKRFFVHETESLEVYLDEIMQIHKDSIPVDKIRDVYPDPSEAEDKQNSFWICQRLWGKGFDAQELT